MPVPGGACVVKHSVPGVCPRSDQECHQGGVVGVGFVVGEGGVG